MFARVQIIKSSLGFIKWEYPVNDGVQAELLIFQKLVQALEVEL